MDNFVVSSRKYRPTTFDSVVGQENIVNTLKNAIRSSHLAQAFLFCGPRGVGKTTCARLLAKVINMPDPKTAIDDDSYANVDQETSLNIFELDAASNNSVDDIRNLVDQVRYAPQNGQYKVYIIDEVHMLSTAAFNAFLKTLEEPPSYAIFILATTEKHKIIPTILSRCQIFNFNRIKVDDIAKHLESICIKENTTYEYDGLFVIAQKADGALRDALSMLDQINTFSGGNISFKAVIENLNIIDYEYYFKATDYLISENLSDCLLLFDKVLGIGFEGINFLLGLSEHFRNLLVAQNQKTIVLMELSENIKAKYIKQSQDATASFLISALNVLNKAETSYRDAKNQRLHTEIALMKLAHLQRAIAIGNGTQPETQQAPTPASEYAISRPIAMVKEPEAKITESHTVVAKPAPINAVPREVSGTFKITNLKALKTNQNKNNTGTIDKPSVAARNQAIDLSVLQIDINSIQEQVKISSVFAQTILSRKPIAITPQGKIIIEVINALETESINDIKEKVLTHLRNKHLNDDIDITYVNVDKLEGITIKNNFVSDAEKYALLLQENPLLENLKKTLKLSFVN